MKAAILHLPPQAPAMPEEPTPAEETPRDALHEYRHSGVSWMAVDTRAVERWMAAVVASGVPFTEELALVDLHLAIDRNTVKPARYLAKRWGWGKTKAAEFIALHTVKTEQTERTTGGQLPDNERTKERDSRTESKNERTTGGHSADKSRTVLPDLQTTEEEQQQQVRAKPPVVTFEESENPQIRPPALSEALEETRQRSIPDDIAEAAYDRLRSRGWRTYHGQPLYEWRSAMRDECRFLTKPNTSNTTNNRNGKPQSTPAGKPQTDYGQRRAVGNGALDPDEWHRAFPDDPPGG